MAKNQNSSNANATVTKIKTMIKFSEITAGGADGAIWEMSDGTYDVRILKQFKSAKGTELLGTSQGISTVKAIAFAASLNPKAKAALSEGDVFAYDPSTTFSMTIKDKKISSLVIKGDA